MSRLSITVVISGAFATILLLLPGNVRPQLADVMRSWSDDPARFFWAVAATVGLTAMIWILGTLEMHVPVGSVRDPGRDRQDGKLHLMGAIALLGLGVLWRETPGALWPTSLIVAALWLLGALWLILVPRPLEDEVGPTNPEGTLRQTLGKLAASPMAAGMDPTNRVDPVARFRRVELRRPLGILVAFPIYVFGLAYLRYSDLVLGGMAIVRAVVVVVVGLGLSACLLLIVGRPPRAPRPWARMRPRVATGAGVALGLLTIGVGIYAHFRPFGAARIGTVGLIGVFLIAVAGLLAVVSLAARRVPRGLLGQLGFRRVPVVFLAVAVVLLAGHFDGNVGYHEAAIWHRVPSAGVHTPRSGVGLPALVDEFEKLQRRGVQPMLVVASSGGGARAAYWTTLVLNCLFTTSPSAEKCPAHGLDWNQVWFASGISGGSVGLAMFDAKNLASPASPVPDSVFDDGFLDPVMAQMLFSDAPNALIRFDGDRGDRPADRARVLEQSWERRLPAIGSQRLWASQAPNGVPRRPVLLLNSTSIADGCRINVSVLDLAPNGAAARDGKGLPNCRGLVGTSTDGDKPLTSTRDLADFLCAREDMRLSTAALLSARFPFVSPTGALQECAAKGADRLFAVDGGYVDSSAASPLTELLPRFVDEIDASTPSSPTTAPGTTAQPEAKAPAVCVQPVVLQIDNGYSNVVASNSTQRPGELVAPLIGWAAAGSARADTARQALERAAVLRPCAAAARPKSNRFHQTYFHLYPEARPGIEAPLGWSLSEQARSDLVDQLASRRNACEISRLVAVMQDRLTSSAQDSRCHQDPPVDRLPAEPQLPGGLAQQIGLTLLLAAWILIVGKRWNDLALAEEPANA